MKHDWIKLRLFDENPYDVNPNVLICEHCGKTQELSSKSAPIKTWIETCEAFLKLHKNCKPKV